MKSTAKAIALARDLADKLSKRYAAGAAGLNTVRQAFDANGWPMIFCSHNANEAAGQPVLAMRISNVDAVSKDIFGAATSAYAPHILELAYELQATPNIGDSFVSHADKASADFESQRIGARWQLKEIANATAVSEASMNAATPVADLEDLYWPTKSV
jgi:hypothetical protein